MHTTDFVDKVPLRVHSEFSDLWLSTRVVSYFLVVGGFLSVVISELAGQAPQLELSFALCCYLAAGLIEICWNLRPSLGRWIAACLISVLVPVGAALWTNPGLLVIIPIPVILAMSMLGSRGAMAAALVMTLTVVVLTAMAAPLFTLAAATVVVPALWSILGFLLAVYRPILQMAEWSRVYNDGAQKLLDQARDRNAELNQVLSTLVHVNRQLDLANERLAAARLVAEKAQKSKADFVAKVSHEFRTPLNMIIGLSEFLVRQIDRGGKHLPQEMWKDIQVIHRNSEHLSTMIDDVLNLSQAEAGQLILHRRGVNLADEIEEAFSVVMPLLDKKSLKAEIEVSDNLPVVYCDPVRIRQVLLNLISNAARHTDSGHVRVGAEADDRYVSISVTDTGLGIAQNDLAHIFEPFFRGERSIAEQGQGSGLGLTISRQLIEQHDGTIWATSEVGKGSTFVFRLPLAPVAVPVPVAKGWISEDWTWKERTVRVELPKRMAEWRMIICDKTGKAYSLFSRFTTGEVELVETQNLAETGAQLEEIPAHVVVLHEENPADLWLRLFEARLLIPDTPLVGCCLPSAAEHQKTPDIVDYLVKPVTRSDLRDVLETLSHPVRRVLVVDDDPEVRALFARMLLDLNPELEIVTAADGDVALEWMRANHGDLVLLDIFMPVRDGWSVLKEKQAIPHMRDVPVLIMSAQDSDVQIENSSIMAATAADGIPGEFIVESAFRLASRLRNRPDTRDPVCRETPGC